MLALTSCRANAGGQGTWIVTRGWVLALTLCRANAGGQGVAQDVLVAVEEGEGASHREPLPRRGPGVRAPREGDVLPQAVGQGLVGSARGHHIFPLA